MTEAKALARYEGGFGLPDAETARTQIKAIAEFQALVHQELKEGFDYGTIPGTQRPTLLKPGAEKISKLLKLGDSFEIVDQVKDWAKPFFHFVVRCHLKAFDGTPISEGLGECNSMEAKYRYRWVYERDIPPSYTIASMVKQERTAKGGGRFLVYRVENEDIYSQVNTILKMAEKRSFVDAVLHAGRLSDVFTQDIEDLRENEVIDGEGRTVEDPPEDKSHYCKEHKTIWFKRGNMRQFAHPVKDSGYEVKDNEGKTIWCNEPTEKPAAPTERATEPPLPDDGTRPIPPKPQPKAAAPAQAKAQQSFTYDEVTAALGMPMAEWIKANPGKGTADAMKQVRWVKEGGTV